MYKLYWSKMSGAMAPQALFEEIGIEYEKIIVDIEEEANRNAEFLAVNPMGQIPALGLPDGTLMTESAAMVLHIVGCHPEAGLAPPPGSPESAQFLRWLLFMASSVYNADLRLYYPEHFSNDGAGLDAIKAAALADMDRYFSILDAALDPGPYLLGEGFSAVDVYLWMLAAWHPDPQQMQTRNPRIAGLVERVRARPAISRIWPEHEGG